MSYKCGICGVNDVDNQGDICELCAIGHDPYAQYMASSQEILFAQQGNNVNNSQSAQVSYIPKKGTRRKVLLGGGTAIANQDPYGNDMAPVVSQPTVQVYSPGQFPQTISQQTSTTNNLGNAQSIGKGPITTGIIKNVSVENQKRTKVERWFRALFTGIPFTFDDDLVMFQVFPDYSGTVLNAQGNACDQVILYGQLNKGSISDNNDVDVYGHRDSNNNIIAKYLINKASGTRIAPRRIISSGVVWFLTLLVFSAVVAVLLALGPIGIIFAIVIIFCLRQLFRRIRRRW